MKTVSAREANQSFSKLLAAAADGEEVLITRRGKPVARLGPASAVELDRKRAAAVKRMTRRMKRGIALGGVKVVRDEIYKR
ncbi:MAG: type II toxin-antitoxin system prevent-host-death family antitoxin [Alphaproteobacteria bacterium]|jgi:prevent-host-death family protein|nr:prevent-host-death protein [Rhodospirillaceae bacterium]MDP6403706.1 type II toxin-antitoxin system prevent-host-death family antitoxin [Alphaproteobacteria bacterium]MDP6623125.1 type II toxin-antitoxin system prevent-host-death family antitoxin [Alphaproteobacteria bacterium]|tara:strand:- start:391 stop:633 length:243 start_codon:yes stop_codon:yes gene_type:complete